MGIEYMKYMNVYIQYIYTEKNYTAINLNIMAFFSDAIGM